MRREDEHFNMYGACCKKKTSQISLRGFFSGISWNRTSDTRIFSPLLYQLSYDTVPLSERLPW